MKRFRVLFLIPIFLLSACQQSVTFQPMPLVVNSSAFTNNGAIPREYTCDGDSISPAVSWSHEPANTVSYAMIVDDPDAPSGTWVHWVIFNIPAGERGLPHGIDHSETFPDGSSQGVNSSGGVGYTGPCPPNGVHHYYFKVYALDTMLSLHPRATKEELLNAMEGHVLAEGQLVGTYTRE